MRHLIVMLSLLVPCVGDAANVPTGTWVVKQQIAFDIYRCQEAACGKVVWLRNPAERTMCGRVIIWGLTTDGSAQWDGGWFYNPEDGKTYNVSAELKSADVLIARIYLGSPLLGETKTLTRVPRGTSKGWC